MTIRGKGAFLSVAAILLFFLPTARWALAEPPVTQPQVIRMATLAPEGYVWVKLWRKTFDKIMAKSGGRVRFQLHAGGIMGDEPEVIEKVRRGEIEAAGVTMNGAHRMDPAIAVLTLPYLFESDAEYTHVVDSLFETFRSRMWERGWRLLLIGLQGGAAALYSTSPPSPIRDLLSKEAFWVWEGEPTVHAWYESVGVRKTVPLRIGDVSQALREGSVTVFRTTPPSMVALGWFEYVRTIYMLESAYLVAVIAISRRAWEDLPQDVREVIEAESRTLLPVFNKRTLYDEEIALLGMSKRHVTFVHPSPEEVAWLKERSMAGWKKLEGKMFPPELLKRVIEIRDEFRKQNLRDK